MRRSINILLILAMLFTSIFPLVNQAYAITTYQKVTKYHLDIGAQHIWGTADSNGNITWQNGNEKGGTIDASTTISFSEDISNVKVYPLTSSNFKWGTPNYSFNGTNYLTDQASYRDNYAPYASNSVNNITYSSSGKDVSFSYTAALDSITDFDLKKRLNSGGFQEIIDILGGTDNVKNYYPSVYSRLEAGANGVASNVYGFMYFVPIVIQYDVIEAVEIPVGDFSPGLDVPDSAKQGETFPVTDTTAFDKPEEFAFSELSYNINGGTEVKVTNWKGTTLGETIQQSFNEICTVNYTLKVWNNYGDSKTATDSIQIKSNTNVDAKAVLELPEYTYEGHPALAVDRSEFKVNGISYSTRRAYEEGVADNDFTPLPSSSGSARKESKTTAKVTFPKRGYYNVRLDVNTVDGKNLNDTKPIEVRKTPCIVDNLGGFQKQNRKQILNINVATYPGKPITDYYVELLDTKTGDRITLTQANPQQNNATIKTRTLKNSGDEYWTNFCLEFLTKNTGVQEYRYNIYMKDSKGDTDSVQKTFTVNPDLPPNAKIIMQDSFLRNKGTNIAEIIAEDGSTTDGDQLERIWTVDGANVKALPGYQDQSFGSGQKVKHNKTGVGKETLQLFVKDIWNEPTLEEYVTEADRLSSSTDATTDVLNIAPTVRLEPIDTEQADIKILTSKASQPGIEAGLNSLKAALIEAGIDANIQVLPVAKANSDGYRNVMQHSWPVSINCACCQATGMLFDSDYAYKVQSVARTVSGNIEICTHPHTIYALKPGDPLTGETEKTAWSYTVNDSSSFRLQLDDADRYVYIICNDTSKTIILNQDNGAYVTTLNLAIPGKPYVSSINDSLYFLQADRILKYDPDTKTLKTVINRGGSIGSMVDGKLAFVGRESSNRFYIGKFDMNSETLQTVSLPELSNGTYTQGSKGDIGPVDMDCKGKVAFVQNLRNDYEKIDVGSYIWIADAKTQTSYRIERIDTVSTQVNSVGFVKDETGEAKYLYHGFGIDGSGSKIYRHYTLNVYTLGDENTAPIVRTIYAQKNQRQNWSGISYAKLHSQENAIYIMQGADFGLNGLTMGVQCRIQLPSWSAEFIESGGSWGWDSAEEAGAYNDFLSATYYRQESWTGMTHRIKLYKNSITQEQAEKSVLQRLGSCRENTISIIKRDYLGDISNFVSEIKEVLNAKTSALLLSGDNGLNRAEIGRRISLDYDTQYEYEYHMKVPTGGAVDVLNVTSENGSLPQSKSYVLAAEKDYQSGGTSDYFIAYSSGGVNFSNAAGLNSGKEGYRGSFQSYLEFTMEKPGYAEFDYFNSSSSYAASTEYHNISLDSNELIKYDYSGLGGSISSSKKLLYLTAGKHRITFSGYTSYFAYSGIRNIKVYYEKTQAASNAPETTQNHAGKDGGVVKGTFTTKSNSEYQLQKSIEAPLLKESFTGGSPVLANYLHFYDGGYIFGSYGWSFGADGRASVGDKGGTMTVTAPPDKWVIIKYDEGSYQYVKNYGVTSISNSGDIQVIDKYTILIKPGGTLNKSFTVASSRSTFISNIRLAVIDDSEFRSIYTENDLVSASSNSMMLEKSDTTGYIGMNFTNDKLIIEKYAKNQQYGKQQQLGITFNTNKAAEMLQAYVSDFKLYRVANGLRQLLFSEKFDNSTQIRNKSTAAGIWNRIATGTGKAEIVQLEKPEIQKDAPLVYKKGQLVAYNIFYDDYEKDPSKKQYWRYTHTPMNDGAHPQAAFVLDEDGNMVSSSGAILPASIPRFYIDGKYTVEHWQEDNTNRTGDSSEKTDYTKYDKLSNIETITFYVEGGATAPWITSIKTIPGTVKEGDFYKLQIGVDDAEKDELRLTTEVYKDKKLIYTHKQTGIVADIAGKFPLTVTGNPPLAVAGKFEVVCTVRDWSGAGIGSYKFIVVSGGKITGHVVHTEQWDQNRKKYNLKRFSDEINRKLQLNDYLAMSIPRKRGTNVFWSGEKFMLQAETEGNPVKIKVNIFSSDSTGSLKDTGYSTYLTRSGEKTAKGEEIWKGSLWDRMMINQWGRKSPEELTFRFTAYFSGDKTKLYDDKVILDSDRDYWQLHRLW